MANAAPYIPDYRIISELGRGGLSTVYLAEQERMFLRRVALKVMSAQVAQQEGFGERFLREAKIASNLSHRNIVHIYDTGQVEGSYYLAMEYLGGGDLARLSGSKLPQRDVIMVVASVLEALDVASSRGVVHRDVKPANIMFREDGTVTLVDFGIAFQHEPDSRFTPSGAMLGTPHYMSPEQVEGLTVDERSDIYSVGAVLFELLAGWPPYDGDSPFAIAAKQRLDPIPRLPVEHSAFQSVIDKAMAKLPDDRFQSASEFLNQLTAAQGASFKGAVLQDLSRASVSPRQTHDRASAATESHEFSPTDGREECVEGLRAENRTVRDSRRPGRSWPMYLILGILLVVGASGSWRLLLWFEAGNEGGQPVLQTPPVASGASDKPLDYEKRFNELEALINYYRPVGYESLSRDLESAYADFHALPVATEGEHRALEWKLLYTSVMRELDRQPRQFTVGSSEQQIEAAFAECRQAISDCQLSWYQSERERSVVIEPFYLASSEASVRQFDDFVADTGYVTDAQRRGFSFEYLRGVAGRAPGLSWRYPFNPEVAADPAMPATHLSPDDARAFCAWLDGRLPTADEWEYASRGPERRVYTWGDSWDPSMAPIREERPQRVGELNQDAFFVGVSGLTGNIWEWVSLGGGAFGLKGGSHREVLPVNLRSAAHREEIPNVTLSDDGVRCAFDADSWPRTRSPKRITQRSSG